MYICTKCDAQSPKWAGRCSVCNAWGTLQEEVTTAKAAHLPAKKAAPAKSARLFDVATQNEYDRVQTADPEIDRVFGGGMVKGSLILIAGEPGIGKSTMVAAIAGSVAKEGQEVLYVSGEESAAQLAARFARLEKETTHVRVIDPLPIETVISTIEKEKPAVVVVDSAQTMTSSEIESAPGTPALVRYGTSLLLDLAKRTGTTILIVGQVTKDGNVAGPKTLEHLVDTVLYLEGDPVHAYRLLRSRKNRFGSTDEIGVFEMTAKGLLAVENPSAKFLEERSPTPGSVITATLEGSRVFLVEVQALVEKTSYGTPVRRASGFDQNRLQMLIAILSKHAGLKLGEQDVYVNVIGGLKLTEPAADLAVCAAILGATKNTTEEHPSIYIGEVGLSGETRTIPLLKRRVEEAKRLGMTQAFVSGKNKPSIDGMLLKQISTIKNL
jgi:DNA repair protein RadA/Sms